MTEPANIAELSLSMAHPGIRIGVRDECFREVRLSVLDTLLDRSERLERAVELLRVTGSRHWHGAAMHEAAVQALLAEHDAAKEAT